MTTDSTSFQDRQPARLILATDEKIRTKKDSPNLDADVKHPLQPPIYIYFLFSDIVLFQKWIYRKLVVSQKYLLPGHDLDAKGYDIPETDWDKQNFVSKEVYEKNDLLVLPEAQGPDLEHMKQPSSVYDQEAVYSYHGAREYIRLTG